VSAAVRVSMPLTELAVLLGVGFALGLVVGLAIGWWRR